ncbi:hypothetical protein GCM10010399_64010 [Dactylosporangium fulvum]|uniref:Uncharacterized protein n=1 Tax=Dactylosporangium fulvum TaxID=53359 RepID=A0ABY5W8Y4_9ACTN|nr:hypothetical protein [Dactylosporangium fulvum]UWP85776.1 hypothetical protein Dfulv_16650 [Dactylosporangium fulvum]
MRTLPGNTFLAYTVMHEAHWAPLAWTGLGEPNQINIAATTGGGARWEFIVYEKDGAARLCMYDEAWPAFREIPDFFAALPGLHTLDEVRAVLDSFGAVDQTEREPATR